MNFSKTVKDLLRSAGIELKRVGFGIDPMLDLRAILRRFPQPVVLDVGANEGQTALKMAEIAPAAKIFSFEPNSGVFEVLVKNTRHNPNIVPTRAAMGSAPGKATLRVTGATVNASLLDYDKPTGNDAVVREEVVEVRTLDAFCRERKIENISLLKVDAQGFDLEVLRGAGELFAGNRIAAVFVEVLFVPMYSGQASQQEIFNYLIEKGMKFSGFYGINREDDFYIHWCDALFVSPSLGKCLSRV